VRNFALKIHVLCQDALVVMIVTTSVRVFVMNSHVQFPNARIVLIVRTNAMCEFLQPKYVCRSTMPGLCFLLAR